MRRWGWTIVPIILWVTVIQQLYVIPAVLNIEYSQHHHEYTDPHYMKIARPIVVLMYVMICQCCPLTLLLSVLVCYYVAT